ncbi:MAG: TetR family transcriptional regulator [Alphaproteobacteria bacterium]|nr:TetR family transcriptional regulator [Alphaproteobacteria bacterium]
MNDPQRISRRNEILDIATGTLSEKGYRGTSMLEVARRASASKETLYAWFGDKQGLFEAVIRRNAQSVQTVFAAQLENEAAIEPTLVAFGSALLELLLDDHAIAINRAAISEVNMGSGLAQILSAAGREETLPHFILFLERHQQSGKLRPADPAQAAEEYLGLLMGDLQIRRLLGLIPMPKKKEIRQRAKRASARFLHLHGSA